MHLPLSIEAQTEAHVLMLAPNNIFSPANGTPIISPSQDIVLGIYYITVDREGDKGENMKFNSVEEAFLAYDLGKIAMHTRIFVRLTGRNQVVPTERRARPLCPISDEAWKLSESQRKLRNPEYVIKPKPKNFKGNVVLTTVGRCIFNDILPKQMPFYNFAVTSAGGSSVIADCYAQLGRPGDHQVARRRMKAVGFRRSTLAGLSFGITDIRTPETKATILEEGQKKADKIERNYRMGAITEQERYAQLLDIWAHARKQVTDDLMTGLENDYRAEDGRPVAPKAGGSLRYLNPINMMA